MNRNSPRRYSLLMAVVVAGLVATGCTAGVTVSAQGTAKPTPIPARTLPPTHPPSLFPTGTPSLHSPAVTLPTPTVKPGKGPKVSYRVFGEHVQASLTELHLILGSIERHSDPLNVPRLVTDLDDAAIWAGSLTAWLNENRPRPCYEVTHTALTTAVVKYEEGFDLMASALTALDEVKLRQGMGVIEQANLVLERARPDTCGQQHSEG